VLVKIGTRGGARDWGGDRLGAVIGRKSSFFAGCVPTGELPFLDDWNSNSHMSPSLWPSMRDGIGSGAGVCGKGRGHRGGDEWGEGGVLRPSREEPRRMEGRRWGQLPGGGVGSQGKSILTV